MTPIQDSAWYHWFQPIYTNSAWSQWVYLPYSYNEAHPAPPAPPATFDQWHQRLGPAEQKAIELLRQHLTEEQVAELEAHNAFHLEGASGRLYRFGRDGTVARLLPFDVMPVEARELPHHQLPVDATFCIHPAEHFPAGDRVLSCKLLLQHDEPAFLRIANITEVVDLGRAV